LNFLKLAKNFLPTRQKRSAQLSEAADAMEAKAENPKREIIQFPRNKTFYLLVDSGVEEKVARILCGGGEREKSFFR
jgi:hypothetical protein